MTRKEAYSDLMVKGTIRDRTPLSILFSIVRTWQVLDRYLELELMKHGSNTIRFAIMNTLYRHGGQLTPTELSAEVFRSKNSITSVIHKLEKEGFIRREPSKNDGRSVTIVITEKGWGKTNKITPIAQKISYDILSCLDREQIDTLMNILRTIRKSLLQRISNSAIEYQNAGTRGGDT